jgi:hypothetical protein
VDEQHFQQQIDPAIIRLARFKSGQLAGRYGLAEYDAEDIQQDLLLDYLCRCKSYDARRCNHFTFARLVIDNCIATIIETRTASCRNHGTRPVSLDEQLDRHDPNSAAFAETLIDPQTRSLEAQLNLFLDIDRFLSCLPAGLVRICRSIMVCDTCVTAAAKVGLSRATFYRQIRSMRKELSRGGLGEKLGSSRREHR